jgi:NAD+ synthase
MDLCLYAKNNNLPIAQASETTGLTSDQVQRVFEDIDTKRATTRYLHMGAVLVEEVEEIQKCIEGVH